MPATQDALKTYRRIFEATTGYPGYRVLNGGGIATENCGSIRIPSYALIAPNGNCRFYDKPATFDQ